MRIRRLSIHNFRGIRHLDWSPNEPIICFIGAGDSTKTTILTALEYALSPRWNVQFDDSDFYNLDISQSIKIQVTVGDVPQALMRDDKFDCHKRGWGVNGLIDEPDDESEEVLTIQLKVDSSLEPQWKVITDRDDEGKTISSRDRGLLGTVRVGAYVDQHFAWNRNSALSRLTIANDNETATILTTVNRSARDSANLNTINTLKDVIERANKQADTFAVNKSTEFTPRMDTRAMSIGMGSIAIHDGNIPFRLAGLGSRRLFAFGLQLLQFENGTVLLIDEIEHSLEPYRIRNLLSQLKQLVESDNTSVNQVILTTHSPVVVQTLSASNLAVVRTSQGTTIIKHGSNEIQSYLRSTPDAFLSRRIIICEGKTEEGICMALDIHWQEEENKPPFANFGLIAINGGGHTSPKPALTLHQLDYETCLFLDSDDLESLHTTLAEYRGDNGKVICWKEDDKVCTEQRIINDLPSNLLDDFLKLAIECCTIKSDGNLSSDEARDRVISQINSKLDSQVNTVQMQGNISSWGISEEDIRNAMGLAAKSKTGAWFKRIDVGQKLGEFICAHWSEFSNESDLIYKLLDLKAWVYND